MPLREEMPEIPAGLDEAERREAQFPHCPAPAPAPTPCLETAS